MKRIFLTAALVTMTAITMAQSGFTIRRPADGQVVRETVEVRIPRNAIPEGAGFVGIWVNGRFLEAVSPFSGVNTDSRDFIYKLDTKGRRIPDGQMTIECVLYAADNRRTTPMGKTSVVVRLDNSGSINIPASGLRLRYKFLPNQEYVYNVQFKSSVQSLTETQDQMGSQGGTIDLGGESLRYRFTVMNTYSNSNGTKESLLLMQPLTQRGKDYAYLTVAGETKPKKYMDYEMHPLYMRITDTGREIFGSIPTYAASETSFGEFNRLDLFALFPMPILPAAGVKPNGVPFPAAVANADLNLDKRDEFLKFTSLGQARGELQGIEFERGRPCAKVLVSMAQGDPKSAVQEYKEYYWFALDLGVPIKIERNFVTVMRVRVQPSGGGGGAQGGGNPGRPGQEGQGNGGGANQGMDLKSIYGDSYSLGAGAIFDNTIYQSRGGVGRRQPGGSGGGTNAAGGGGGSRGSGGTRVIRQRTMYTMILE